MYCVDGESQAALDEAGPEVAVLCGEVQNRPSVVDLVWGFSSFDLWKDHGGPVGTAGQAQRVAGIVRACKGSAAARGKGFSSVATSRPEGISIRREAPSNLCASVGEYSMVMTLA